MFDLINLKKSINFDFKNKKIRDEKLEWQVTPRINHHNEEYLKYKEQSNILRREKTYVQVKYDLRLI